MYLFAVERPVVTMYGSVIVLVNCCGWNVAVMIAKYHVHQQNYDSDCRIDKIKRLLQVARMSL